MQIGDQKKGLIINAETDKREICLAYIQVSLDLCIGTKSRYCLATLITSFSSSIRINDISIDI